MGHVSSIEKEHTYVIWFRYLRMWNMIDENREIYFLPPGFRRLNPPQLREFNKIMIPDTSAAFWWHWLRTNPKYFYNYSHWDFFYDTPEVVPWLAQELYKETIEDREKHKEEIRKKLKVDIYYGLYKKNKKQKRETLPASKHYVLSSKRCSMYHL